MRLCDTLLLFVNSAKHHMKHYVTVFAFTVSSFVSLRSQAASTPIEAIPEAARIEIHIRQDASVEYLTQVRGALATRGVHITFTSVLYDDAGQLSEIAFQVSNDLDETPVAKTYHSTVTPEAGAYLFVEFARSEELEA